MNHANMHYQQLQQKNPDQAAQLEEPLQQMATYLGQIVQKEANNQEAMAAAEQAPAEEAAVPAGGGYE